MSQLSDLYEQAVRSGNTDQATYYAQALAAQHGMSIQGVTGASASQLPGSSASNGFFNLPALPSLSDIAGALFTGSGLGLANDLLTTNAKAASDATKTTGAALGFITDIPRVVTTVLGIILIIAGIFALSKGPAVQIVGGHLADAVVG